MRTYPGISELAPLRENDFFVTAVREERSNWRGAIRPKLSRCISRYYARLNRINACFLSKQAMSLYKIMYYVAQYYEVQYHK